MSKVQSINGASFPPTSRGDGVTPSPRRTMVARRGDGAAESTGAHRRRGRVAATAAREATEAVRGAAAREPVAAFFCGGGRGWVVSSKYVL